MSDTTASSAAPALQPVLFIPHGGGPCFFMDWSPADTWNGMAEFLKGVAATLPERPEAVVLVSGHWQTPGFSVTASAQPGLIYDYYGFPPHTYQLTYPAPGEPALARQIVQRITDAGLQGGLDAERGFDHGVFIPLKLVFPDADIPVVQLSLRADLDPGAHVALGEALAGLRAEGVLIVGSGMSFHNMRGYGDARYTAPSEAFDAWLTEAVQAESSVRNAALRDWAQAPFAHHCHPAGHEEHLLPLMVVAGAAGEDRGRKLYSQQVMKTQLSAFRFG